jgi:hypothetical protein
MFMLLNAGNYKQHRFWFFSVVKTFLHYFVKIGQLYQKLKVGARAEKEL